ncbi:hypothetical protein FSP39_004534 [Pinctada imbricata]|uniref:Nuclear protein 1 n=1 Tax=Pinctada imbricata TaxID=66713 RepID=A0AA89C9W3_PINIB|nr:hypothetical protein FSP39_004534 [Pinctada imbricata]
MSTADEKYLDEYDEYNIEEDKYKAHGHSGKGRSKKEAEQHVHSDPGGHSRKITNNMVQGAHNKANEKGPVTKKE